MATGLAWLFGLLAAAAIGYTVQAALAMAALARRAMPSGAAEPVSVLKPLNGAEPRLVDNLATFLDQQWDAPIELVAGVQRRDDPALAVAEELARTARDHRHVAIVADATPHGANAKVANLINMLPTTHHALIVLSDSDMAVPRDYLATLAGALAVPGVGAVTCLYRGRGDAGAWSRFAAAAVSYQFLPSVVLGVRLGRARPCMGSTIAMRRATLDAIGGFARVADRLDDDYAIGAAVRALGLSVAVPPIILVHGCAETNFAALWRHERRWAVTVRAIDPLGHAGSILTHPLPLALLAMPFAPRIGLILSGIALAARCSLKHVVDRVAGISSAPAWMLPPRDLLSFALFLASFATRSVDWRGSKLRMGRDGRIAAASELAP